MLATSTLWAAFGQIAAEVELTRHPVVPAPLQAPPPAAAFRAAIETAINRWVALWNSYDLDQLRVLFLDDPRLSYFSSEKQGAFHGFPALVTHHQGFGFVAGGKAVHTLLWLDQVAIDVFGDAAVVMGVWHFRRNPGAEGRLQKGPCTFVYVVAGGRPKLVHMNFGNYPDPLPPK